MASKPTKQSKKPSGDGRHDKITLEQRERLVSGYRNECRAHLKLLKDARLDLPEGTTDASLVGQVNSLSKTVAILSAEARQLDKHRQSAVDNITQEQEQLMVIEWLSEISPQRRAEIRKHLNDLAADDTLLGH